MAARRQDYDYLIKLLLIGDSGAPRCRICPGAVWRATTARRHGGAAAAVQGQRPALSRRAGVGKSCLLLRFSEDSFTSSFITTIGCARRGGARRAVRRPLQPLWLGVMLCAAGAQHRLQNKEDPAGKQVGEAADLGHGRAGAFPHHHQRCAPRRAAAAHAAVRCVADWEARAAYYRGAMGILLVYDVTDDASFTNIRNWMRNIEQHASDSVNKARPGAATVSRAGRSPEGGNCLRGSGRGGFPALLAVTARVDACGALLVQRSHTAWHTSPAGHCAKAARRGAAGAGGQQVRHGRGQARSALQQGPGARGRVRHPVFRDQRQKQRERRRGAPPAPPGVPARRSHGHASAPVAHSDPALICVTTPGRPLRRAAASASAPRERSAHAHRAGLQCRSPQRSAAPVWLTRQARRARRCFSRSLRR